jgi:hypothetical protein
MSGRRGLGRPRATDLQEVMNAILHRFEQLRLAAPFRAFRHALSATAKKIKGRKRHIVVDTLGLIVHGEGVQDCPFRQIAMQSPARCLIMHA